MHDCPHACRDQPADPDVIHPGAHQHPREMSAPRHGVPHSTGEETEEGGRSKDKRGEVLRGGGDLWKLVPQPDRSRHEMGMNIH